MNLYLIDLRQAGLDYAQTVTFSSYEINLIKNEMKNPQNKFIFFALHENWPHTHLNSALNVFGVEFFQENCVVVVDRIVENHHKVNFYNVIRYDSQLIKVALDEELHEYNKEINLDTGKFLFLMGKPYKHHRIGALYQLEKNNLLNKCDYSFVFHENYYKKTRAILPFLSEKEFEDFISRTQRTLDNIEIDLLAENYNYLGVPVDPNLYKNTSFSLISESMCSSTPHWFLSEKFWRTIASHHMFIIMADELSIDFLHNQGFNTFQHFLKIDKNELNKYLHQSIDELIIGSSVKNVEHLLNILPENKNVIEFYIKHNYKMYKKCIQDTRNIIDKTIEKYLYVYAYPIGIDGYRRLRKLPINDELYAGVKKLWDI